MRHRRPAAPSLLALLTALILALPLPPTPALAQAPGGPDDAPLIDGEHELIVFTPQHAAPEELRRAERQGLDIQSVQLHRRTLAACRPEHNGIAIQLTGSLHVVAPAAGRGLESLTPLALALHPRDAAIAWVGTAAGSYRTVDAGQSWQSMAELPREPVYALAVIVILQTALGG